jgi:hypothetical protein
MQTETDSIFAMGFLFGFDSSLCGDGIPLLEIFAHELAQLLGLPAWRRWRPAVSREHAFPARRKIVRS